MQLNKDITETYLRTGFALIAAFGALLIGELVYLDQYLTTDEDSYLFQAWLFLQGDLKAHCPGLTKSFFHRMIVCDGQLGWFSRYPPAHSIWLMPGIAVGFPRLMTAVAAFLSVWYLTKAGQRLGISIFITAVIVLISPYFWLMQGSVLSHTSGLAAAAIMIWAYLVWLQDRKISFAAIAGLAWAFLFLNRTYTAFLIALPFAVHALVELNNRRNWHNFKGTVIFAGCAGSGAILFFIYNYLASGDPFMPTYLLYDPKDGLGFGQRHSIRNVSVIHTPLIGLEFIWNNLVTLNVRLYGFFGSLFVLVVLAVIGWDRKLSPMFVAASLLVWIGYGAFWFEGIEWVQPIYWYETLAFITLLAGLGLQKLYSKPKSTVISKLGVIIISGITLLIIGRFSFATFDEAAQKITDDLEFKKLYEEIIHGVPPDSIVILGRVHKDTMSWNSFNPRGLDSDPLVVRDGLGVKHALYHLFPDRSVYRVDGHEGEPAKLIKDHDGKIPTIYPRDLANIIGKFDESAGFLIAEESVDQQGRLGYGVHKYFIPGHYKVTFYFEALSSDNLDIAKVEVKAGYGAQTLAARVVQSGETQATLEMDISKIKIAEPRIHFTGMGKLVLKKIEIDYTPITQD